MCYMFRKCFLNDGQYIFGIHLRNFDITEDLVHFCLKYPPRSAHAHWELVLYEFFKFGDNGCHVFTMRGKIYGVLSHVEIQKIAHLNTFNWCVVLTVLYRGYAFHTSCLLIIRRSFINLTVPYFLGTMIIVIPYSLCYTGVSNIIPTNFCISFWNISFFIIGNRLYR